MTTDRARMLVVTTARRDRDDPRSTARAIARAGAALGLRTTLVPAGDVADGQTGAPGVVAVFADGADAVDRAAAVAAGLGLPWPLPTTDADRCATGEPGWLVQLVDGRVLGLIEEVGPAGERGYDCAGRANGRAERVLADLAVGALRDRGPRTGPATVRIVGTGPTARVTGVLSGSIDALHAMLIELVTGVDPVSATVALASGVASGRAAGAMLRSGTGIRRYAALRFVDVEPAATREIMAVPGLVAVHPGPGGYLIAMADRPKAARSALATAAELVLAGAR